MPVCKAPDCNEPFEPSRRGKVYCSRRCQRRISSRRWREAKPEYYRDRVNQYYARTGWYVKYKRTLQRRIDQRLQEAL